MPLDGFHRLRSHHLGTWRPYLGQNKQGGFFQINNVDTDSTHKQFYWPQTNILITRFFSDHGVSQVIDFMPVKGSNDQWRNGVIRMVECIRGEMTFKSRCYPSFNYARDDHEVIKVNDHHFQHEIG